MVKSNLITVYKLFRKKNGKYYPLFVDRTTELPSGTWISAKIGDKADDTHVKSSLGALSLRPGFHSTTVPFANWIGKKQNGKLVQRKDTVWCECFIDGEQQIVTAKNGLRTLPDGWYEFKTNAKQVYPWLISNRIMINRELSYSEVCALCKGAGLVAQELEV